MKKIKVDWAQYFAFRLLGLCAGGMFLGSVIGKFICSSSAGFWFGAGAGFVIGSLIAYFGMPKENNGLHFMFFGIYDGDNGSGFVFWVLPQ